MDKIAAVVSLLLLAQGCTMGSESGTARPPTVRGSTVTPLQPVERKLIEFGFDVPSAAFVAEHVTRMERRPFDGVVFRPGPDGARWRAFDVRPWSVDELRLDTLREIAWSQFTDNFLHLYGASFSTMDWFDDDHWRTINANLQLYRRAVEACRCVGVAFDPEYYGGQNPWAYTPSTYGGRTFEAVRAQVRARGAEFVTALRQPGEPLTILFFFLLGYVRQDLASGIALRDSRYALLPAFLDGILDAGDSGLTIVDGNEDAYHYEDTNQFFEASSGIHAASELIAAENRTAYQTQVQVGSSLFVDRVLAEKPKEYGQTLWMHNVYTALASSDRYVWCYSQEQDWWRGDLIPGSARGIRLARARLGALEPLGFDLADASGPSSVLEVPTVELSMSAGRELVARVSGSDVAWVDFYRSGELVTRDERAPFRLVLDTPAFGPVTYIARAFDGDGRHGTSAPVQVPS